MPALPLFLWLVSLLQSSQEALQVEHPLGIPDLRADGNHVSFLTTLQAPALLQAFLLGEADGGGQRGHPVGFSPGWFFAGGGWL